MNLISKIAGVVVLAVIPSFAVAQEVDVPRGVYIHEISGSTRWLAASDNASEIVGAEIAMAADRCASPNPKARIVALRYRVEGVTRAAPSEPGRPARWTLRGSLQLSDRGASEPFATWPISVSADQGRLTPPIGSAIRPLARAFGDEVCALLSAFN